MALRGVAIMSVLATGVACAVETPPAHAQPTTQAVSVPQSRAQPAEPPPTREECKVIIEGGDDLLRAIVSTKSGDTIAQIMHGHELSFDCPPIAEWGDADIVGERSPSEIVHWPNVDLRAQGEQPPRLESAKSKDGLPPHWTEEHKQQYREQNQLYWEQNPDPSPTERPQAKPAKVEVTFKVAGLDWAEIEISGNGLREPRPLELDPNVTTKLLPGRYRVKVRREQGGRLFEAGTLDVPNKQASTVLIRDKPAWSVELQK